MSTQTIQTTSDLINDYLNDLCDGNGYWAGRLTTLCAILALNQDWDLDGNELDQLSEGMVAGGFPPASNEEVTRALWERGFETEFFDSNLLIEIINEVGLDAEEVIEAAREIGVDEDILQEVAEELAA